MFSREHDRQQIALSPGCSCLPWKCVCVYLLLERGISFFLPLLPKTNGRARTHTFLGKLFCTCAFGACDTCCEVAARRGLRNNPTKINISKPHLYVWLKIQSQFPLFHFLCTAEAKPHETEFTRKPKVCVYAHCDIFWNYIIVWQTLKLIFFSSTRLWWDCQPTLQHTRKHTPQNTSSGLHVGGRDNG